MLNGYHLCVFIVCMSSFLIEHFAIHPFFNLFTDRNVECLKLLLNSGADLSKKDNFGR